MFRRRLTQTCVVGVLGSASIYGLSRPRKRDFHYFDEGPLLPRRIDLLPKLNQKYDLLVVGGGCVGCGTALDAASRGLKVLLVDQGDFAGETSSKSTKLLWAGSRYLVNSLVALLSRDTLAAPLESWRTFMSTFKMVLSCHDERSLLLQANPHLTRWIPLVCPMDSWLLWPPPFDFPPAAFGPMGLFAFFFVFYDFLGKFVAPFSFLLSPESLATEIPRLTGKNGQMKYGQVFYEGIHDDARTCLAIGLQAFQFGAQLLNYMKVTNVSQTADGQSIQLEDTLTGQGHAVDAKAVVFCAGPQTDALRSCHAEAPENKVILNSGGTHVVFPLEKFFKNEAYGVVDMNTSDGRFLFILPWQGQVVVGTTDVRKTGVECRASQEEVDWILKECCTMFSGLELTNDDILSVWHGNRALMYQELKMDSSKKSRDHFMGQDPNSCWWIAGGKWTTYREMAKDMVDEVVARYFPAAGPCITQKLPLYGSGYHSDQLGLWESPEEVAQLVADKYQINMSLASHLAHKYGSRALNLQATHGFVPLHPHHTLSAAEVHYQIDQEMALTLEDLLCRRSRIAFVDLQAAQALVSPLAGILADVFGWSDQQRRQAEQECQTQLSEKFAV